MKTHDLDLNAILERVRKEVSDGYNAALQEVGRFVTPILESRWKEHLEPRTARHGRFFDGSLTALVLNKIEAHPGGIFAVEIKDCYVRGLGLRQPSAVRQRVDTALTRLKSHYGAIVKKDDGKWYPVTEDSSAREQEA